MVASSRQQVFQSVSTWRWVLHKNDCYFQAENILRHQHYSVAIWGINMENESTKNAQKTKWGMSHFQVFWLLLFWGGSPPIMNENSSQWNYFCWCIFGKTILLAPNTCAGSRLYSFIRLSDGYMSWLRTQSHKVNRLKTLYQPLWQPSVES